MEEIETCRYPDFSPGVNAGVKKAKKNGDLSMHTLIVKLILSSLY